MHGRQLRNTEACSSCDFCCSCCSRVPASFWWRCVLHILTTNTALIQPPRTDYRYLDVITSDTKNNNNEIKLILLWLFLCFCHRQNGARGTMFSGCPSVRVSVLVRTRYLINRSEEFHQICSFGALENKHEVIRFWGQKVKGQGHN